MGAPRDELGAGRYSDVQVQVTLTRGFLMGRTEVTNADWLAAGWGPPQRHVAIGAATCREPQCPVSNVSFFDAIRYTNWLSERAGLPACYQLDGCSGSVGLDLECTKVTLASATAYECEGFRLPMEAEWEYAARAGTRSAFYTGEAVTGLLDSCASEPALEAIAWYCMNAGGRAHAVAQKSPNGWGLHDMLGNVYEWCNDLHDGLGYGAGPWRDPQGSHTAGRDLLPAGDTGRIAGRIARGGDYVLAADACTAADRGSIPSFASSSAVGFRVVRTLAASAAAR